MEVTFNGIREAEFEQVFKTHFKALHAYAITMLKSEAEAEETVQQVFFKLWEKRSRVNINQSITAYLYSAVYNECLNYLKHEKVKKKHQDYARHASLTGTESISKEIVAKELESKISETLNRLPEQCRTIFQMSRFEALKYREIAGKLNLSVKTVENQMGKALKIMREHLMEYLPTLLFLILNLC